MPDFVRPLLRAAIATALATAAGARLGLRGVPARDGLKLGAAVTAVIAAGVAAGTTAPPVRAGMIDRTPPGQGWGWLAWQIPVGTVWTEEMIFRGAVATVARRALGAERGRLLQAALFGLAHVPNARRAGESVAGTVAVTGAAGWVFGWLADRSGSLLAPMLAHLAINESGALATLAVRRAYTAPTRAAIQGSASSNA
ncbi:Rv0804 family intramembrane glutamic endopeptidase [Mycolicibacterium insubricum]|uniref:Abortive phage infection protein n=2 Tax=Mycolicibacterium insubricum TaxID=444597 RepID=A0A1X0D9J5_9MYCO|nr:CPBP family intramembrane glutamic endopeptidase [Mycolicibacterium insubricum]ORA69051.1 abortive phage infection protein [Mycolicibacterium insubricum]